MGLNKQGNQIYLTISNGQIVRAFKQPTADTKERINKKGNTVYEETFKDITGQLVNVSTKDGEYGKQLLITINDGEQDYQLQTNFSGRYSSSFLKALPNIDLSKEIRLMPWQMADKNDAKKMIQGITLYQGGKIAPAYTKEDPNGLPEMEKIQQKVKGKLTTTWDDTAMMEFLEKMAAGLFKSKPKAAEKEKDLDAVFGKEEKGFVPIESSDEKPPF